MKMTEWLNALDGSSAFELGLCIMFVVWMIDRFVFK